MLGCGSAIVVVGAMTKPLMVTSVEKGGKVSGVTALLRHDHTI